MLYSFCILFLMFIIYSIIGYMVEIIGCTIESRKIVLNRGYLIGPYIPIFGLGSILMILLLDKYKKDPIALFIMSTVICAILEYLTSLIMEKVFKLRWWDYSNKKFNINGRICLEIGVLFGIGGVLIVKVINPYIEGFLLSMPNVLIIILAILLMIIFIVDFIESTYISFRLKINVSKYINKDATREIKKEVMKAIHKNTTLTTRLIKAFPNLTYTSNKKFKDMMKKIEKAREEVKIQKNKKNRKRKK